MFSAFRTAARATARRTYATAAPSANAGAAEEFLAHRAHVKEHAAGSAELWRKIT